MSTRRDSPDGRIVASGAADNAPGAGDPKPALAGGFPSKSGNPTGTLNQEFLDPLLAPAPDPNHEQFGEAGRDKSQDNVRKKDDGEGL
jgi:hypothetical protein